MNTRFRFDFGCLAKVIVLSVSVCAGLPLAYAVDKDLQTRPETPVSEAAVINPLDTLQPELRGDLLMTRKQYLAAITAYKDVGGESPILQNKIGIAYHQMFDLLDARRAYERALRLNPHYPEALNNLGAIYYGEHNYRKAERLYKESLKFSPTAASVYSNLGTVYFAEGHPKKGAQAYQQALQLDPAVFDHNSAARVEQTGAVHERALMSYALAKTFAQAGRNDKAIEYLRIAMDEGFDDRRKIMGDKELATLRTTPEFQRLMTSQKMQ